MRYNFGGFRYYQGADGGIYVDIKGNFTRLTKKACELVPMGYIKGFNLELFKAHYSLFE